MARLVGLPEWHVLCNEIIRRDPGVRIGQFVWNKYGVNGIDGKGWPELFYADNSTAIDILEEYRGCGQGG